MVNCDSSVAPPLNLFPQFQANQVAKPSLSQMSVHCFSETLLPYHWCADLVRERVEADARRTGSGSWSGPRARSPSEDGRRSAHGADRVERVGDAVVVGLEGDDLVLTRRRRGVQRRLLRWGERTLPGVVEPERVAARGPWPSRPRRS